MSRIETLKKQFRALDFSIIDLLSEIDGTESHKYLQFLCKVVKLRNFKERSKGNELAHQEIITELKSYGIESSGSFDVDYIKLSFLDRYVERSDVKIFHQFKSHMENGLIDNSDITKYSSFSDMSNAVSLAELRILEKDYRTKVFKEYEDDNWLMVRPLSFKSSCKYGSGTKWCTTFSTDKQYFFKYFFKSTLIYIINKKTGYKVAMHGITTDYGKLYDVTFWNSSDTRMDFLELEVDDYLVSHIKKIINSNVSNCSFLSKSELMELAVECNSMFRLNDNLLKCSEEVELIPEEHPTLNMRA
jgi:hypothetical protein